MQTIQTIYRNGNVIAKCWIGGTKSQFDAQLSSEGNHKAAAEKLIKKLNANKSPQWEIKASAPAVPGVRGANNGWVFMIGYVPESVPTHMSITVRFMGATNTGPAYMKAHSWLRPNGLKVNYSPKVADGSDIQANARYAAETLLEVMNAECASHGVKWAIKDYVETYNGDRLFTLGYAK